ncbi:MAG TPA: hypothetical protein VID48_06470 [Solirubrobacteraceae bacterium]
MERDGERTTRIGARIGALALAAIVICSGLIVMMAANRPSFLAATTHVHYFPSWMAGPLGGLWPGLTRNNTTLKYLFSGAVVLMYVCYLLGLKYVRELSMRPVVAAVLLVHVILFLAPPMALTDIFNYVNYARMEVVHHLNPYATIPILEPHNDPSFALSNWHHLLSPYGPLFTLISFTVAPFGVAASFWMFKGILMFASLATIALVYRCARLLGRDPAQAIVFVGLNPVVTLWGLGGDHNDFIMVFLIVLGFYLLLLSRRSKAPASAPAAVQGNGHLPQIDAVITRPSQRPGPLRWLLTLSPLAVGAGVAFMLAAFVKASAAILIPVVLASLGRSPRRLLGAVLGMFAAAVVLAIVSLIAFGPHLPDLSTQGRVVTSVSLPNLLGLALGQGGETNTMRALLFVALAVTVVLCIVEAWRRQESLSATGWATVALVVTLSWVLPWYVLWVLPLAALSSSRRLRTTALVLGAYLIIAWVPVSSSVFRDIGFNPSKTPLGKQHQRTVKQLLN